MIYDLHNDLLTSKFSAMEIKEEIIKNKTENIFPIYAVFTTELKEPLTYCETAKRLISDGRFAIEDMHFADEENIERIINFRPAYCGLTWNYDNALAGGAHGDGNLTDLGKKIINRLNENDICIDVAHLNRKSFWKVMENDPKKVICSHTCFDFINSHLRNLTKEQIYAILLCKGIIGICFVPEFIVGKEYAPIDNLCDHIIAFLNNFGDDGLALGTDFYGTSHRVEGLNNYSDLSFLRNALLRRGINNETIDKIFYLNAKRFWSTEG